MTFYIFRIISILTGMGITAATFSIVMISGNIAPTLTVTAPENGVRAGDVELSAEASDPDGSIQYVEFYINEQQVARVSEAPYTTTATLPAGTHTYTVVARDNRMASTVQHRDELVVVDGNTAPVIESMTPADGTELMAGPTLFEVNANDVDGEIVEVRLFLNDQYLIALDSPPYQDLVAPLRGAQTWRAEVEDNDGAVTTLQHSFVLGPNLPPVITSFSPENGSEISQGEIVIDVQANDPDGTIRRFEISINGVLTSTFAGPPQPVMANLSSGANVIEARVTDNEGLTTTEQVSVNGNTAPVIESMTPADGTELMAGPTLFKVNANDVDGEIVEVRLFLNDQYLIALNSPPYQDLVAPLRGAQTWRAEVEDNDGAVTTLQHSFVLGPNLPPVITSFSPENGSEISQGEIVIDVQANDPDGTIRRFEISINGVLTSTFAGPPQPVMANLSSGANVIEARVTDNEGLTTTEQVSVNVQPPPNAAPSFTILTPETGSVLAPFQPFTVTGSFTDEDEGDILVATLYVDGVSVGTITEQNFEIVLDGLVPGEHTIRGEVMDDKGATGTASINVSVSQPAPIAELDLPATSGLVVLTYAEIAGEGPVADPSLWEFYSDDGLPLQVHSTVNGEPLPDDRFYAWLPPEAEVDSIIVQPGATPFSGRMAVVDATFNEQAETFGEFFAEDDTIEFNTNDKDAYVVCGFSSPDLVLLDIADPYNPVILTNASVIDANGELCALFSDTIASSIFVLVSSPDYLTIDREK